MKSAPEMHGVFLVHLKSVNNDYACNFKVMDKNIICGEIARVKSSDWFKQLKSNGVSLSDIGEDMKPIDLLIDADVAGKLLTG